MFNTKLVICHSWFHVVRVCLQRQKRITHYFTLIIFRSARTQRYLSRGRLYVGSPRTHSLFLRPEESLLTLPYCACACERLWGCDWVVPTGSALVFISEFKEELTLCDLKWDEEKKVHNMSVSDLKRRTYCMPAVEFLQQGVVRAFRESAFFIDKSQHAQFLRKEHTDLSTCSPHQPQGSRS